MKEIIEIPSGDILKISEHQLEQLINDGLVFYVSKYMGVEINDFVFQSIYKQDIFDFLDRTGIDNFKNFFR